MTKNLIPEVVKMLGLEIGKNFHLRHFSPSDVMEHEYAINGAGNLKYFDNGQWRACSNISLQDLLGGAYEIIKLKWKPKDGEMYWSFGIVTHDKPVKWEVINNSWINDPYDIALFEKGWVYRTAEEAEAALPAIAQELGVEYKVKGAL